jgi:hypothetical protein
MVSFSVGPYQYESRSTTDYATPPGVSVGAPQPPEPSQRAKALAKILASTRYVPGQGDGDDRMVPMFFGNRDEEMRFQYGDKYTPGTMSGTIDPYANRGEYLRYLMAEAGGGNFAQQMASGGSPGDSDEDMMARNMTRFLRRAPGIVPKEDLALALQQAQASMPPVSPAVGSSYQPGQDQVSGPGTVADMAGAANAANVFGTFGVANFAQGLLNAMKYDTPFGFGYPGMDGEGNQVGGGSFGAGGTGTIGGM